MRPEIREILEPIYHDKLRDHESVLGRAHVQGMGGVNMFWFCHQSPEADHENTPSKENRYEAAMIAKFIEYLILNGIDAEKITILTFYTGQRQCIWMYLRKNPNLKSQVFKIQTVDSFQGEQNDIIILSLVRSNSNGKIGFLENENRVCVALSRAQRGFYIFGNAAMVTSRSNLWWDIGAVLNKPPPKIGYALPITCHKHKERTLIENLGSWEGITAGCKKDCKEKMSCGHTCPLSCHPFGHDQYRCAEPCRMIVPNCGHVCSKQCWEACSCIDCGVPADEILIKPLSENEEGSGVGKVKVKEEAIPPQNFGFDGISKPEPRRRGHGKFKYDGEA